MTRVLIVDDKPEALYLLKVLLQGHGFAVDEARHGAEALVRARQNPPDLVISDLLMPVMDGYTLLRHWKADERLKTVPFIVYTATYTEPQDEKLALDLGADAFILKPAEPEPLVARAQEVLAKARQSGPSPARAPKIDDADLRQNYDEILIRKLEKKTLQLEEANRALREDVARRQQAEARVDHLNQLLRAIRDVNQLIAHEREPRQLLSKACQILVHTRGYLLVWIGHPEAAGKRVIPVARAGSRADYLDQILITWDEGATARGPVGTALRTRQPRVCQDTATDPDFAPWRAPALERGYASMAAMPMIHGECLSGVLSVYAGRPAAFDAEEITLLEDLATDLAFALHSIEQGQARARGEEQIRAQASLLDLARDAIMVRDLDNHVLYWNKGAELMFGWTAEEAKGRQSAALYQTETAEFTQARERLLAAGEWAGELRLTTRDGRKITVGSRWTLVRDAESQPKSVLVINTDITDMKKLEGERLRAQRIDSIGTLANGIAHDLNNILMPIGLVVSMLREQAEDPTTLRWLDMMEANVQRGAAIIKQVLTFSRGRQSEKIPTQTRLVLTEVANIIRETFPKTIRLETDWPKDLWLVLGDLTQLQQVLMNLAINARDAMPGGGTLKVAAENLVVDEVFACTVPGAHAGSYVAWLVADTGQGISPEHLERIFDPFFTTKEVGKGTGLGLSTVIGIVRDHHGFIRVESNLGVGTQFRVYLPAEPEGAAVADASSQSKPQGNDELILVVDDEESIRKAVKSVLERNGYRVLVANDGIEALALVTQGAHRIDAVLTDLIMPQMDGLTLIRTLQKVAPQIKTLTTTGGETASRSGPLSLEGINTVLHKPFTPAALLQSLRALLDEPPSPPTVCAVKDG